MRFLLLFFYITTFVVTSCQDTKTSEKTPTNETKKDIKTTEVKKIKKPERPEKITNKNVEAFLTVYGKNNPERFVKLETKFGDIEIELFNETPLHRSNFIHIVKRGFLSETCFYRVAKGFVIQGGNSDKFSMARIKNRIGSFTIPHEFKNNLKHNYGAVAMARIWKGNPEKRSSPFEFYIVVDPNGSHHLDREHTVIGRVTKGMSVAKKINLLEVDKSEWPIDDVYMKASVIK